MKTRLKLIDLFQSVLQRPGLFDPAALAEAAAIGKPTIRTRATETRGPALSSHTIHAKLPPSSLTLTYPTVSGCDICDLHDLWKGASLTSSTYPGRSCDQRPVS